MVPLSSPKRFQSTPAHQDGRNSTTSCARFRTQEVSIHSRPPGREKPQRQFEQWISGQFQSTPAHQDGRNARMLGRISQTGFQSTPAHQDGRNAIMKAPGTTFTGFNPLPPTRTGETGLSGGKTNAGYVSIHSRPPGREKLTFSLTAFPQAQVSIHSRPPGREKRPGVKIRPFAIVFQSTPAHQDGRNRENEFRVTIREVSIHSRPPGREKPSDFP